MAVVYTHDLEIVIAGKTYEADVEFNVDGLPSYEFNSSYNLRLSQAQLFNELIKVVYDMFNEWSLENPGDIEKIEIVLKP